MWCCEIVVVDIFPWHFIVADVCSIFLHLHWIVWFLFFSVAYRYFFDVISFCSHMFGIAVTEIKCSKLQTCVTSKQIVHFLEMQLRMLVIPSNVYRLNWCSFFATHSCSLTRIMFDRRSSVVFMKRNKSGFFSINLTYRKWRTYKSWTIFNRFVWWSHRYYVEYIFV